MKVDKKGKYNSMYFRQGKFLFAILIITLFFFSCRKFVTIDTPKDQLLITNVFRNNETAISALTSIYSQMLNKAHWPYYISFYCGLYSDELRNYNLSQSYIEFYTNSLNATDGGYNMIWTSGYNYIYQANVILENIDKSPAISEPVKKQLKGEALFIRAFCNFYLVNLFGDIPLVTTTNSSINSKLARSPEGEVYKQIVNDLLIAKDLLNEEYVDFGSVNKSADRVRPNKWAMVAFLSRVYLFMKDWKNAALSATEVINKTDLYTLEENLDNVFLTTSREAIFRFQSAGQGSGNNNTYEGLYYILTGVPGNGTVAGSSSISPQLLNALKNKNDTRLRSWIGDFETDSLIYYYPFKYKMQQSETISEYSVVIRLAELYLIRSEAFAHMENLKASLDDLNAIRNRAGLNDTLINNQTPLLAEILSERQVELFTEWGHRWLDLKRTGAVSDVMSKIAPAKDAIWEEYKQLWPIPNPEIEKDLSLTQNVGY